MNDHPPANRICKADLHVHSMHSDQPSMPTLQRLESPECFTDPKALYESARKRGMDFVTVTDHDSIDGSLAIADLPGTFISAELTSWLPEDGCKLHVVTLDIPPELFPDMLEARDDVRDLVAFLRAHDVPHFIAHPLFSINGKLAADTFEKLLLLFETIEVRNGARSGRYNRFTEAVVRALTPERIEQLAVKHGIEPVGEEPWRKAIVGGSDDHSGLFVAATHTAAECDGTIGGFLQALRERRTEPAGDVGDTLVLAHSIYAYTAQFFAHGGMTKVNRTPKRPRSAHGKPPFLFYAVRKYFGMNGSKLTIADKARLVALRFTPESWRRPPRTIEEVLEREAWRMLKDREFLASLKPATLNRRAFAVTSRLTNRLTQEYADRLFDLNLENGLADLIEPISTIALVQLLSMPYYGAFHNQTRNRRLLYELAERFPEAGQTPPTRIALFTDTLSEVNGVAPTVRRLRALAEAQGVELVLITCTDEPTGFHDGVMNFHSIGAIQAPQYPDLAFRLPPILEVLDYIDREGFTDVHVTTPGTVGLLGLLAAKLMDLPAVGSFHTDLPQYVRHLTDNTRLEDLAWRASIWFHSQFDELLVPSQAAMDRLAAHGMSREAMRPLPRWIDTDRFSPRHRDAGIWPELGVLGDVRLLYAGRLTREEGLSMLVDVFRELVDRGHDASLVVVGNGPYRHEMEKRLFGYPATFLGYVPEDEVPRVYASADLLLFPGVRDTYGNGILEAQASGLPVVVSDRGGAQELLQPGHTGLVLPADRHDVWIATLEELAADAGRRTGMGAAAREFVMAHAAAQDEHFSALLCSGNGRRSGGADGNGRNGGPSPSSGSLAERLNLLTGETLVELRSSDSDI